MNKNKIKVKGSKNTGFVLKVNDIPVQTFATKKHAVKHKKRMKKLVA